MDLGFVNCLNNDLAETASRLLLLATQCATNSAALADNPIQFAGYETFFVDDHFVKA